MISGWEHVKIKTKAAKNEKYPQKNGERERMIKRIKIFIVQDTNENCDKHIIKRKEFRAKEVKILSKNSEIMKRRPSKAVNLYTPGPWPPCWRRHLSAAARCLHDQT